MQKPSVLIMLKTSYQSQDIQKLLSSIRKVYGENTVFLQTPENKTKELLENVFTKLIPVANPDEIKQENNNFSISLRPGRIADYITQQAAAVSIKADAVRDYVNGPSSSPLPLIRQIEGILDSPLFASSSDDIVINGPEAISAFRFITCLADRIHAEKMAGKMPVQPFILKTSAVYQIVHYEMPSHTILWIDGTESGKLTAAVQTSPGKYMILPIEREPSDAFRAAVTAMLKLASKNGPNEYTADFLYSRGLSGRFIKTDGKDSSWQDTAPTYAEKAAADELVRETKAYLSMSVLTTDEIRKFL